MVPSPTRLLVVHHSPTAVSRALTDAVLGGTQDPELAELDVDLEVVTRPALEATADDVATADAVLLGTTANFGYMSGALKHFFDSSFLALGGALSDDGQGSDSGPSSPGKLPFGLWVHGRYDTTGATRSVLAITQALPWRQAVAPLELLGDLDEAALAAAHELGATLAALTVEPR